RVLVDAREAERRLLAADVQTEEDARRLRAVGRRRDDRRCGPSAVPAWGTSAAEGCCRDRLRSGDMTVALQDVDVAVGRERRRVRVAVAETNRLRVTRV